MVRRLGLAVFAFGLLASGSVHAQQNPAIGNGAASMANGAVMFPFVLPPFDDAPSPTDVSFLNDGAAGQFGFVRTEGENFVDGRGQKLRFWGVNLNFGGVFPSKTDAPHIAGRLAKFGFNAVRLHHFEGNAAPSGLWQPSKVGSLTPKWPLTVVEDQFDKLDFFVAELIKRGIYVDLNLHVARKTTDADGLPQSDQLPEKDKGIAYFNPVLEAKNKEFARLLLTHVNPYTGLAYKDEPGVCAVEVDNENSILAYWLDGTLNKLPATYTEQLRVKWNAWLAQKYPSESRLRRAWTEISTPLGANNLLAPTPPPLPPTPVLPQPDPAPAVPPVLPPVTPDVPAPDPAANPPAPNPAPDAPAVPEVPAPEPLPVPPVVPPAPQTPVAPVASNPSVPSPLALQGWTLNTAGGAVGIAARDEFAGPAIGGIVQPGLSIQLQGAGTVSWAFQLVRDGLTLDSGKPYTLSFWARSDVLRTISLNVWEDVKPFRWMGVTLNQKITTEWQQYTLTFRPSGTTPGHARLTFNFGASVGLVQMGGMALVNGGRIGAPDTWTLRAGVPVIDVKNEAVQAVRRDYARFLGSLESAYVAEMRRFLKDDIGVKVPIWHTQALFGGWGGVLREMDSDAIDVHAYWKHPDLSASGWNGDKWRIEQQSMASNPLGDPLAAYALMRPPGKPFVMTEWNSGQPLDYGSESLLMAAAYASHQNWAGVWLFDYHSAGAWDRNKFENFFSIDSHPTKMATAPAAALIFRRSDVAPATSTATLTLAPDREWDEVANTPSPPSPVPFTKTWLGAGAPRGLSLQGRTAVVNAATSFNVPSFASLEAPSFIASDTDQIFRDGKAGLWSVDSPRAKTWVGNWSGSHMRLGEVEAWFEAGGAWHAGSLVALDGSDLGRSRQMLLTLAGRAENLGMGWNPEHTSVGSKWGNGPTQVSTAAALFRLCCDDPALRVWALDERGQRRLEVPSSWRDGVLKFTVSPDYQTLWYEIGR